jgi:hypothetical protein
MASIQKKNKFRKLHLCPWSFAQGQKEKVNKKMEEKEEKEKRNKRNKKKKKKKKKKNKKMEEKENGKEPGKCKGSWSQREVTTIDEFEMVPDSEDDCQMFCWVQKKEKMAKAKDKKDKELERLQAPLKWRPCTDLFQGDPCTDVLPLQVSEEEIEFSKNSNLRVKTKRKIHIDRERGRDRLHRDRMAKAEWPELSQRRIEFNGWQKHISEDPEEYVEIGCDVQSGLN